MIKFLTFLRASAKVSFRVHAVEHVLSAALDRNVVRVVKARVGDIALLQLEKPIEYDHKYIAPICLPPASNHSFDANSCLVTGLGYVDEENGICIALN